MVRKFQESDAKPLSRNVTSIPVKSVDNFLTEVVSKKDTLGLKNPMYSEISI
jgi:hypothetical protein